MILPGSYANGFAPRDGRPLYPELWRGCVGAWNPGLGPSGLTLRDQSGFKNNGTLTAGPTFAASGGRYAMKFDGVDDYVDVGTGLDQNGEVTISTWIKPDSVAVGTMTLVGNAGSDGNSIDYKLEINRTAGKISLLRNDAAITVTSNSSLSAGVWYHVVGVLSGVTSNWTATIYLNGQADGSATTMLNPNGTNSSTHIGKTATTGIQFYNGFIDDVRIYNRALSPNEIRTLATRRGIAYELAPRRRSSSAVAAFNRRRRLLLGST